MHKAAPYTLQYLCGQPPASGQVREVAPGVLWLRMPVPFEFDHINLWALADQDAHGPGWAIVDIGTKTPEALAAWLQLIAVDSAPQRRRDRAHRRARLARHHRSSAFARACLLAER